MKRLATLIALFAAIGATPALAGAAWKVVEGQRGSVKGTWNVVVLGAEIKGAASMFGPTGQPVTYSLAGKMENGAYTVRRLAPSDGVECTYRGAPKADGAIAGMANCGGQTGPWLAKPDRK
jgi:hypothetical protein